MIVSLAMFFITCQKETVEKREYPRLKTGSHNVQANGVRIYAEILAQGDEEIIDHGVAWNHVSTINLDLSESISLGKLNDSKLDVFIDRNIESGRKYYAAPYLITENYTVFGGIIAFEGVNVSSKSKIIDFEPKTGEAGDTVTIYGENFGIINRPKVLFGDVDAKIISNNQSCIKVIVPTCMEVTQNIVLVISKNRVISPYKFSQIFPYIIFFKPKTAKYADTITLFTENLKKSNTEYQVLFEEIVAKKILMTDTTIEVVVPMCKLEENTIYLKDYQRNTPTQEKFG